MQYSIVFLTALASAVSAQNPFSINPLPKSISVGTPFNITWSPSTGTTDTVTIVLRQGDPSHLNTVATIASSVENSGSYLWTPTSAIPNAANYAFEIVDDGNPVIVNYSGQFSISSPNTDDSLLNAAGDMLGGLAAGATMSAGANIGGMSAGVNMGVGSSGATMSAGANVGGMTAGANAGVGMTGATMSAGASAETGSAGASTRAGNAAATTTMSNSGASQTGSVSENQNNATSTSVPSTNAAAGVKVGGSFIALVGAFIAFL